MKLITEEAKKGKIIIFTIHQPRSDIFKLFDKLILLAQGKVIYLGKAKEAVEYFSNINFKCPLNYNPAEYFINILSKESMLSEDYMGLDDKKLEDEETKFNQKIEVFSERFKQNYKFKEVNLVAKDNNNIDNSFKQHGWVIELMILIKRNRLLLMRDKLAFYVRLIMVFFNSILIVMIFFRLEKGENAVIDRNGCLFYITNSVVNTNMNEFACIHKGKTSVL